MASETNETREKSLNFLEEISTRLYQMIAA